MSQEDPKTYNLEDVSFNFLGVPILGGYGDGSAIKIEKADPSFTSKVGADGTVVWVATNRRLYKVTLTLMQTAAGNQVLSAIHQADKIKKGGVGVGALSIIDGNGTSLHHFSKARIMTDPSVEYNADATNRDWEFAAVADIFNVGSS